jgi:hypothetical protein
MINKNAYRELSRSKSIKPFAIYAVSVLAAAIMAFTSCSPKTAPSTTISTSTPITSQTTIYTNETVTSTSSSTTTEPTTSTTTPTALPTVTTPETFIDLQPYLIDGKSPFLVENSANYTQTKIQLGITNAGKKDAMPTNSENSSVIVELYNASQKCYEWDVQKISAGEKITLETTVGELLEKNAYIKPGVNYLNIKIYLKNGTEPNTTNNNSAEYNIVLARAPTPVKEATTDLEKIISSLFSGETKVFISGNETEALNIVKPFLTGFGINYNTVTFTLADYDYVAPEVKKTLGWDFPYGLDTAGFVRGGSSQQQILLENGTAVQLLPVLMRELVGAYFLQKNPYLVGATAKVLDEKGNPLYGNEIMISLGSWYAIKALDEAGFGGYTNVSYNTKSAISYLSASREQVYVKCILATYIIADEMAQELGYNDRSQINSKDIENKILQLSEKSPADIVNYLQGVVSKVYKMSNTEVSKIIEELNWTGFCDKEPDAAFPENIRALLDPKNKFGDIHPDDVSAVQIWFLLPR